MSPSALPLLPQFHNAVDPARIAAAWLAYFTLQSSAAMPREEAVPEQPLAVIAAFAALALAEGRSLVVLVPDDEPLPELSNALDIGIRPLCLVLPGADFAARIALRATLSLMKSRLARDAEDEQTPAWRRQRERLAEKAELWRNAQEWAARNDRSAPPEDVTDIFPARILPIAAYRALRQRSSDITLLFRCDAPAELVAMPGTLLHVGTHADPLSHRQLVPASEDERLRLELSQLTRDVADLELELATAQGEMAEFTRRYYEQVGRRMTELDALQARLARERARQAPEMPEAAEEARRTEHRAEQSARERERFERIQADEPPTFKPQADVKRLFRQLAQKIHPDRATSEADRAWRTHLMSEANRAYRAGDEKALKEVAALWEEGMEKRADQAMAAMSATPDTPAEAAATQLLRRQVERMRARLEEIERQLHLLFGSRLYELFIAARQARRQGRDLLAEMADKLDESIGALRQQLGEQADTVSRHPGAANEDGALCKAA